MRDSVPVTGTKTWSLFDLEVLAPGRIQYPLHAGIWDPAPPGPLTMDIHQGMEIGMVLRGKVERHFEDLVYVARPGDLHLCSAWEPHGWRVMQDNTSQVVLVFLAEVVKDREFRDIPWLSFFTVPPAQRPQTSSSAMREEILSIGHRLHREARQQPAGWRIAVRLCLLELLLTLHRYWRPAQPSSRAAPVPAGNFARVMPAVTMVYGNPAQYVSSDEAAAACGLHRSRFNSIFHQTMGVSFQDFCRRARLASVAHLLLATELPTDTIADEAGFADGSHLHRTFVQYYGVTPGRYRATHRRTA